MKIQEYYDRKKFKNEFGILKLSKNRQNQNPPPKTKNKPKLTKPLPLKPTKLISWSSQQKKRIVVMEVIVKLRMRIIMDKLKKYTILIIM